MSISSTTTYMPIEYVKGQTRTLRDLGFDERWLQERVDEDPSILGLGDLTVIERERNQPSGGRIDFLLSDPEEGTRYEVEIMLGTLNESHIIRTIEYWDVERTRYPQLEHRAVIVAEEITNRFFNVISLLNRAVPIIAIQLSALQLGNQFSLTFTKVLDIADLFGPDEEATGEQVDRPYWEKKANPASLAIVDKCVMLISSMGKQPRVTYNKYHIAIGTTGRNFLWCHPRKNASHCHLEFLVSGDERTSWIARLDEVGITASPRGKNMKVRLTGKELSGNESIVKHLLGDAEAKSRPVSSD